MIYQFVFWGSDDMGLASFTAAHVLRDGKAA